MAKLPSEKAFFRPKSVRRDLWSPMHISILMDSSLGRYLSTFQISSKFAEKWLNYRRRKYRHFNGLKFGLISTHISSFIEIGRKMAKLSSEKAIFSTKISQAWPVVTHAYRHFNGLKFGLISSHIWSFIKIGRKMTKLSSEKAIFSTKITQAWRVITHAERGLGGTIAHPNIYLHSKFHQDWSRNDWVINGKPQTLTTERQRERQKPE